MNRLDTPLGNDGFHEPSDLKCYEGLYRFADRTFGIKVYARDIDEARRYCADHGMRFGDEIIESIE